MSEGYCDVDLGEACDDAEPVEFVNRRSVVAKKAHKCSICRGDIAVGETHEVAAYKFEGEFQTERTCAPCLEASREFGYHLLGGNFWEMMGEEWDNGARVQGCIARLTTARAKEHMRRQWEKWHERKAEYERRRKQAVSKDSGGWLPSAGS